MKSVTSHGAQQHFVELIEQAMRGDPVRITRADGSAAVLISEAAFRGLTDLKDTLERWRLELDALEARLRRYASVPDPVPESKPASAPSP